MSITIIVHQCNCISTDAKGLAYQIFNKYPYANTYNKTRIPGTIDILGEHPTIINIYAQYYPSYPKYNDNATQRFEWFKSCLTLINNLKATSIAMPFNIGCGYGGDWHIYYQYLVTFSTSNNINITLYKL